MHSEIDPEIIVARRLRAPILAGVNVSALPSAEARAIADKSQEVFNDYLPDLDRVEELQIPGPDGSIRARLYQDADSRSDAAIFYIHGGGWFAGNVDTHDRLLRFLARQSGLTVLAFDYRLSPEFPYPAALDDTRAVWAWLHANGAAHGIPTDKVAVSGDSAGGNLGLALAIDQRDQAGPMPVGLALCYSCFAPGLMTESRERYGASRFGQTGAQLDWYWSNYLGAAAAAPPPLAAPLYADLLGLPPVYLGIPECDIVSDDSRLLATRLADADVPVELEVWPHAIHGVLQMTRDVQLARDAVTSVAQALLRFVA